MPRKSTPAGRLKALVASLTADLSPNGEPLSEAELAFVRFAAANMMRADLIVEAVGREEKVDDGELVRLTNAASRIMRDLVAAKDRRAATAAASGLSPLQQFAADFAARKAAEPVEDDDGDAFETFDPPPGEPVQTPSEPVVEPEPEPEQITPTKPVGPVEIWLNGHAGPTGQTLLEAVQTLRARAPAVKVITLTTPHTSAERSLDDELVAGFNGVGALAGRRQWFVRGVDL
jgi:hypothetical protein